MRGLGGLQPITEAACTTEVLTDHEPTVPRTSPPVKREEAPVVHTIAAPRGECPNPECRHHRDPYRISRATRELVPTPGPDYRRGAQLRGSGRLSREFSERDPNRV